MRQIAVAVALSVLVLTGCSTPRETFSGGPATTTLPKPSRTPTAICRDGTVNFATGQGACSWHGGVREWRLK